MAQAWDMAEGGNAKTNASYKDRLKTNRTLLEHQISFAVFKKGKMFMYIYFVG